MKSFMKTLMMPIMLLLLSAMTCAADDIRLTDDMGREIVLPAPAKRIISLYSAHTENLYALGLDDEIIGVGRVDIYPPAVLEKPRYNYRSDPENVIAAMPDLVLIRPFIQRANPQFVQALEKAGLQVASFYPERFEQFDPYIRQLALLTGTSERAETLLQDFHQAIADIETRMKNVAPKVTVYFESSEKGYKTVTPDSMPARAIHIAGGVNVAQDANAVKAGSSIAAYGVERLLQQADKIDVFVSQRGAMNAGGNVHSISIRPGFHALKAVQQQRIYEINEKIISSPTFRYVTGIRELTRMFYPQQIDDLNVFATDQQLTRAALAEIAVRFTHRPLFVPTSKYYRGKQDGHIYGQFQDVPVEHSDFEVIETAVHAGYMDGVVAEDEERFYPDRLVTRDELAKVLCMLHDFQNTGDPVAIADLGQSSHPKIAQILVNHGVMTCEDGRFEPQRIVTQQEALDSIKTLRAMK